MTLSLLLCRALQLHASVFLFLFQKWWSTLSPLRPMSPLKPGNPSSPWRWRRGRNVYDECWVFYLKYFILSWCLPSCAAGTSLSTPHPMLILPTSGQRGTHIGTFPLSLSFSVLYWHPVVKIQNTRFVFSLLRRCSHHWVMTTLFTTYYTLMLIFWDSCTHAATKISITHSNTISM